MKFITKSNLCTTTFFLGFIVGAVLFNDTFGKDWLFNGLIKESSLIGGLIVAAICTPIGLVLFKIISLFPQFKEKRFCKKCGSPINIDEIICANCTAKGN